mgnify:CR=1 FL=1
MKHVGRTIKQRKKCVVAYRVLPNDPDNCLVVMTENLMADEHDSLLKAVESDAGQSAYEFGEAMARHTLPDGRNMLAGFHTTGKLTKIATNEVEIVPDSRNSIPLNELNQQIADQKGVTVADLALTGEARNDLQKPKEVVDTDIPAEVVEAANEANVDGVLSDEELAAKYRSDADRMFKEAQRLRKEADALAPSKKKTKTTESA